MLYGVLAAFDSTPNSGYSIDTSTGAATFIATVSGATGDAYGLAPDLTSTPEPGFRAGDFECVVAVGWLVEDPARKGAEDGRVDCFGTGGNAKQNSNFEGPRVLDRIATT